MHYTYKTKGVCSTEINFDMNDGIVTNVSYQGGCNGNLKAVGKLVDGMRAEDIIAKLKGNTCGFRQTSCADQLAQALEEAMKKN